MKTFNKIALVIMAFAAIATVSCSTDRKGAAVDRVVNNINATENAPIYEVIGLTPFEAHRVGDNIVVNADFSGREERIDEITANAARQIALSNPDAIASLDDLDTKIIFVGQTTYGSPKTVVIPFVEAAIN